jgi:ABC-2 type transport system permease protein
MTPRVTLATAVRVLLQLRHDPRTVALLILIPCVLLALFKGLFSDQPETFNRVGATLVGIFPLISMFLVTSITMLRERTTGTLERLMTMPLANSICCSATGSHLRSSRSSKGRSSPRLPS